MDGGRRSREEYWSCGVEFLMGGGLKMGVVGGRAVGEAVGGACWCVLVRGGGCLVCVIVGSVGAL